MAETQTGCSSSKRAALSASSRVTGDSRSILFQTSSMARSDVFTSMSRPCSTFSTSRRWASVSACEMSRTCRIRSASTTSSSVARKAATSMVGRLEMNPTVSDRMMRRPEGSFTSRMVGSRVAKTWSWARTLGPGNAVEQRRLAGVGVADDGDDRVGDLAAAGAVEFARLDDLRRVRGGWRRCGFAACGGRVRAGLRRGRRRSWRRRRHRRAGVRGGSRRARGGPSGRRGGRVRPAGGLRACGRARRRFRG